MALKADIDGVACGSDAAPGLGVRLLGEIGTIMLRIFSLFHGPELVRPPWGKG
jgi:hypothetical protein